MLKIALTKPPPTTTTCFGELFPPLSRAFPEMLKFRSAIAAEDDAEEDVVMPATDPEAQRRRIKKMEKESTVRN